MNREDGIKIIRNFTQEYFETDEALIGTMESNYKNCYHIAQKLAQGVRNWLDPNTDDSLAITNIDNALETTQRVIDLLKMGNICRDDYFKLIIERHRTLMPLFGKLMRELRDNYFKWGKINSIKRVRELTQCGLKEAKDFVEAMLVADEMMVRNATIKEIIE